MIKTGGKTKFGGKAVLIDRDNINTDEIIPAKYLTLIEKEPLKPHLLEDLNLEGFDRSGLLRGEYRAVISRSNFGSGSSREMAVWAFQVNGIEMIIAANFARIFRENMFNNGLLALELGRDNIETIFKKFGNSRDIRAEADIEKCILRITSGGTSIEFHFTLNKFEHDLIRAGGWVELADMKY